LEKNVTALASRVAGARLVIIIWVLLIPIVLLSYLRIQSHREVIERTDKELAGVAVSDALTQSLVGIASGEIQASGLRKNLASLTDPARRIGAEKHISTLSLAYSSPVMDKTYMVGLTAETLHEVGVHSNLIMDQEPESFFLALHSIIHMPGLVREFHTLQSQLERAIQSSGIDHVEFKQLLVLVGKLSATIEESADSLEHAKEESATPASYAAAEALLADLAQDVDVMVDVVGKAKPGSEPIILSMLARQNFDASGKYRQVSEVWDQTSTRLLALLTDRRETMQKQLYMHIGVSLLCVLLGAGAALWMFASTLKRLDLVEAEKERADAARDESEVARAETERINGEVAELNRNLAEKIRLLKDAQDEIVKKGRMEQMGQLTATIAHELRNPLGAVRTSAFLVEKKVRGLNLGLEAQMQRINNGVQRCDNIITQLLDYSRNKPLQCNPGNLDEWLSRVVSEEAAKLPQSVSIELVLGLEERQVPFDEARLQRAIINLISNAVEAMTTGPKRDMTDTPAEHKLLISTRLDSADAVAIQVKDNGPGISAENLAKVREPLFTTKSFGTGLGIPAIEQIAHQHGGRLEIHSRPGEGATFEIYLPFSMTGQMGANAA
jgi:signal transduction histidine kinase